MYCKTLKEPYFKQQKIQKKNYGKSGLTQIYNNAVEHNPVHTVRHFEGGVLRYEAQALRVPATQKTIYR